MTISLSSDHSLQFIDTSSVVWSLRKAGNCVFQISATAKLDPCSTLLTGMNLNVPASQISPKNSICSALAFLQAQINAIEVSGVQSVTDDGSGVVVVNNTDPLNPIVGFAGVYVDGVTITGDGSAGNPLVSLGGGSSFITSIADTNTIDLAVAAAQLTANLRYVDSSDLDFSDSGAGFTGVLTTTGVVAGSYGDATHVGAFTVDSKGRLTAASSVAITFPTAFITAISDTNTIDLTITGTTLSADLRYVDSADLDFSDSGAGFTGVLTTTGVVAGSYGDATHVGAFTVDAKGRLTAASSVAISTASGTVTDFIFTDANGFDGTVTTSTTTPTLSLTTTVANTQVMFSTSGAITGSASMTWDGTTFTANAIQSTTTIQAGTISNAGTQVKATSNNSLTTSTYRTTNGGSNVTSFLFTGSSAVTAGAISAGFHTTDGLGFYAANGTRNILRVGLLLTNLVNTAGAETADFIINTERTAGAAASESLRITSAGLVGIGATPSRTLHITSQTANTYFRVANSTGAGTYFEAQSIAQDTYLVNNGTGTMYFYTNSVQVMDFSSTQINLRKNTLVVGEFLVQAAGARAEFYNTTASSVMNVFFSATNAVTKKWMLVEFDALNEKLYFVPNGTSVTGVALTVDLVKNLIIGSATIATNATNTFHVYTGTGAPTASITDGILMWSADIVAGNAAPHFRTEAGNIIKLYSETTGVATSAFVGNTSGIVDDSATFGGYKISQVISALKLFGLLT